MMVVTLVAVGYWCTVLPYTFLTYILDWMEGNKSAAFENLGKATAWFVPIILITYLIQEAGGVPGLTQEQLGCFLSGTIIGYLCGFIIRGQLK